MFLRNLNEAVQLGLEDGSIYNSLLGLACFIGLMVIIAAWPE